MLSSDKIRASGENDMTLKCERCGSFNCVELSRRMITNGGFVGILNAGAGSLGLPGMPAEPIADKIVYRCNVCGVTKTTIIHDGKP